MVRSAISLTWREHWPTPLPMPTVGMWALRAALRPASASSTTTAVVGVDAEAFGGEEWKHTGGRVCRPAWSNVCAVDDAVEPICNAQEA